MTDYPEPDETDVTEPEIDRMMAEGEPVKLVPAPHAYRDAVNAPLAPATVEALNRRLAAGDIPVRKVARGVAKLNRSAPDLNSAAPMPTELDPEPSGANETPASVGTSDLRARIAAALREACDYQIVAEWICCDPVRPDHDLCRQGDMARRMVASLLADDPDAAYPSRVLDALMDEIGPDVDLGDLARRTGETRAQAAALVKRADELDRRLREIEAENDRLREQVGAARRYAEDLRTHSSPDVIAVAVLCAAGLDERLDQAGAEPRPGDDRTDR